ncbi:MAG: biotin--[Pseudobutyrivibrio sp.]|uniref:biotin--[acetyl-CoA-carboxylase] ligase n=1 Tax=Pseudobutyrivibrio sp. TaxID=2014367 RepID=UPI0025EB34A0|nr:biotin--[acetyl-CoA-carboxylase] ligase [Pseudobutyrivibrio sp.]MBQ8488852.1 biotin--[acetyl-CoA-carboxylase] ligase [Pseudobutyrivibrio sp.]
MSSKDKVLELLEKNKNTYISGEAIASSLGISRNAIWKAINELRKQGYVIEAVNKKGYRLGESNDIISAQGILSNMDRNIDTALIHIFDTLDSTNKTAKEMAMEGICHGSLIIARSQTIGKGRGTHSFYSPEGGIYMSVILSPEMLPTLEPDVITAYTGITVSDSIESLTGLSPKIKPINDLFIDGCKVCGILTESGIEFDSGMVQWIVVGIGINFDSDISQFPEDLQSIVGSLFKNGQAPISKNQLIAEIYSHLLDWSQINKEQILKKFNERLI